MSDIDMGLQVFPTVKDHGNGSGPELVHTPWGYILTDEDEVQGASLFGRGTGRFIAAIIGLVLIGLWVFPGASSAGDTILFSMKFGLSCLFVGLGGLLYLFCQDLERSTTQIDLIAREVRAGTVDRLGKFQPTAVATFAEISSILIARTPDEAMSAVLLGRIDGDMNAIEIVSGPEDLLEPIRDRLVRNLREDRAALAREKLETLKGRAKVQSRDANVVAPGIAPTAA